MLKTQQVVGFSTIKSRPTAPLCGQKLTWQSKNTGSNFVHSDKFTSEKKGFLTEDLCVPESWSFIGQVATTLHHQDPCWKHHGGGPQTTANQSSLDLLCSGLSCWRWAFSFFCSWACFRRWCSWAKPRWEDETFRGFLNILSVLSTETDSVLQNLHMSLISPVRMRTAAGSPQRSIHLLAWTHTAAVFSDVMGTSTTASFLTPAARHWMLSSGHLYTLNCQNYVKNALYE